MLLVNFICYTKDYKLLLVGNSKIVLHKNIMLVIYNNIRIVYKNGYLKGLLICNVILTGTPYNTIVETTGWTARQLCGCDTHAPHNIPFYEYNNCVVSLYGFSVIQYKSHNYMGGSLDPNLYNLCQI